MVEVMVAVEVRIMVEVLVDVEVMIMVEAILVVEVMVSVVVMMPALMGVIMLGKPYRNCHCRGGGCHGRGLMFIDLRNVSVVLMLIACYQIQVY